MILELLEYLTFFDYPNNTNAGGMLSYPLTGDYFFYAKIYFAIWVIIGLGIFFEELNRIGQSNILSAFAISSTVIIALAFIGTLIGIITADIMILMFVIGIVIIAIWWFKGD